MKPNENRREYPTKQNVVFVFTVIVCSMLLGACGGAGSIRTDCIAVRFDQYTANARGTDVHGVVQNGCEKTIARAKITVTCYDINKVKLDDSSATVRNIASGDKTDFDVTVKATRDETAYCEPAVASAKFK